MLNITRICCFFILLSLSPASLQAADVREFGAVGDGTTDDSAAIERAVQKTSDGSLEFPRGDYRITRTIEIDLAVNGRTSLSGRGGVGRVTMAGAGPAFRFTGTHTGTAAPADFKEEVWQRERMPQVEALEIVGDHAEADGIEFVQVMQPTLRGVLIREVRHGVRLTTRNRNLLIDDATNGVTLCDCDGIIMSGLILDRAQSGSDESGGAIEIFGCRETTVTGCQVFEPQFRGIFVADSRNTRIADNLVMDREGDGESPMLAAIEVAGSARNAVISGNMVGKGSKGDIIAAPGTAVVGENPPAVK